MTVQQLVNLSLRDLDRIRSGQTPSTDESNDSLATLNEILANWSHEGLLVPTHTLTTFTLTGMTAAYTMGVGAAWVTSALPIKIKGAIASLGAFYQGVQILPMGEFEKSIQSGLGDTATLPLKLGVDNAAPQRNVRLWPMPNSSSAVIEVSYWTAMAAVALADTVAFALPAFEEAVRNELTLRLASMYLVPVTPVMMANAQASKLALTRIDPAEVAERPSAPGAPVPQAA